jgi:outer membrane receptor protein involved in Fe transport
VKIFDPSTGQQFVNNVIPQTEISPIAEGLLNYIPLPNLPGEAQNFHFVTSAENSSDDLNVRLNYGLGGTSPRMRGQGSRNSISIGFHYHGSNTDLTNPYPSVGGNTDVRSYDLPLSYTRTFGKLTNIMRADFNRSTTQTQNLYAYTQNIVGGLGINGVSQNPFDWGLPNLSFTNFGSLRDTNPLLLRNQTITFSDYLVWNHGKHTWRWGGDFRRIQLNTATDSNARGSFIFTGLNTSEMINGQPVPGTGFDFADFLLGLPQQTSVQYGTSSYYFRGNSWDLFAQDEWKIRGNLTLNLGLRYEYISPLSEINNHMVNLDVAPGFTAAVPVLPGQAGPYTGLFPATLVKPDRDNFAPRVGIAWKVGRSTVLRAGYGINYNTGAYQNIAQQLAFQPPFSVTQTNIESAATWLTLQNGFPPAPPGSVTNNYGVNPNYRLGYVQIWNLDVQQQITPTVTLNLDYTGTKGTHLDILEAPNRTATGLLIPGVQPFNWETSDGNSVAEAGSLRVRKRLQRGLSIGGTYTFSKSIDNASTIGGGATVVAQNAFNLAAERGLSSFDQRHKFTADYLWELPFGEGRHWTGSGNPLRFVLGDWNWSGDWTIASGMPFTPRVLGNFSDVRSGTNGTLRPDLTGLPIALSQPTTAEWFNTAAFVVPPAGQYGDAARNSITGPGTLLFDMAMTKQFPMSEGRSLELRISASNVFNTPQFTTIDTTVNSPTFGRVTAVGSMRTVQLTARFRF